MNETYQIKNLILIFTINFNYFIFQFCIKLAETKSTSYTHYAPVRHNFYIIKLACVKHVISVHTEPGSNPLYQNFLFKNYLSKNYMLFFKKENKILTKKC